MKGVLARNGTRPVTVPVEVVDLERRKENETLEQGRQMMSFFSAAAFLSLSLSRTFFLFLPFALSHLRVLDTGEFRLASALTLSIVRHPVVRLSFIFTSSSERNERPRNEET